ncbi:amino acid adenylation domain-containing protein [Scytonema sp. NUACC26]|uniref:amino acid adenylation domain-containing protein n=1 Tax=Scytonema sp. NUACC26 TaxID=3140176 RepID=UPI0034DC476E
MSKQDNLSKRRSNLSPEKQALLKKWTRGERKTQLNLIPQRKEQGDPPLSFAQQRLWFLDQLDPNSIYNISAAIRFTGKLKVAALEQSLKEIVLRHEVLRTTFAVVDGQPVQVIHAAPNFTLSVVDLRYLPDIKRETEAKQLAIEATQCTFDLGNGPLLCTTLLQLDEEEHILLLVMHHIVTDGWSMEIFVREASALYQAFCAEEPKPLPELPIQYADFACWQRQWLSGEVLETQLNYWRQQLAGAPPVLELPTDRPRPPRQTFRGSTLKFQLSSNLEQKLLAVSQNSETTLFMTLLAVFVTLLGRYSNQSDIVVGSPIANRNRSEINPLIGFFVNTLMLRIDLKGNPSFSELLARVRQICLDAYAHQDVPFEQVVEALQPERSLSYAPLFQVMFVLQNAPMPKFQLPDLTLLPLPIESATAKFDLTLVLENTSDGLMGSVEYSTDLFDAATIERMVEHYQTLLSAVVVNPHQKLSELPLLSASEQNQILVEWNDTQVPYPEELCLHSLFEQQVRKTPNATAVVFENEHLTYSEVNAKANQLAHHLRELGVEPEMLVGVCVERSLEMVVGLLGILKAGGAYVPIDPEYPPERLAYMLSDSQVKVLLTQEKFASGLAQQQAHLVCLDTNWQEISPASAENPHTEVLPHHLAYVIYTSGSTGKPKGAMNSHQGVCNRILWMQQAYQISAEDRVLQKTPFSFDVSVWEFFWPLITGARLVMAQPGGHRDSAYLVKLIATEQITTLHFVPSMLQVFLEEPLLESSGSLRQVFCSGEALPKELQQRFFARLGCSLHNLYGPTEAAIDVTYWQCQPDSELLSVPIGRAIANTQIYILDRDHQPVPVGVPGELHIGGVGLARGYLNRPELTAEKFIPNPFADRPSQRLYKTGDLVRYFADGNIEYLGRIDHQVKVRGFRIELGEIEAVLGQHPNVRETAVIATQESGTTRLVAYTVAHQQPAPTISELRAFLKQKLPEYMVPSAFVALETLPLTPNGKLDRRALPKPFGQPELTSGFVAPRTPTEEILANIWATVLGIESVGIHNNFFELGGDSILTIQIVAKANAAGVQLSAKQMFEHQTIAELAAVAGTTEAIQAQQGVVSGTLPLTPIQQWFFEQDYSVSAHWNQAVMLEMPPGVRSNLLEQVVHAMLVHHDALRLRFERTDWGWQQTNAPLDDTVPLTVVDLSTIPAAQQPAAIQAKATELQASLNLSTGPLVRVAWLNLGLEFNSRLLVVIHHLAVDGVSWRILLEDLQSAYSQLSSGGAIQLPPKTTAFKDWAQSQWEYVRSQDLQPHRDFWLAQSIQPVASIPLDYPSGANSEASARTVSMSLSVEETRALLTEVPKAYNTQINDVLLTALVQVLAHWTQSTHVLFNLEGHGREEILDRVNVSRTVGWFTTIFPVVLHHATDNPGEALKSIKEQLRRIPSQGMSYGWLRYLLDDAETTAQLTNQGSAQVIFNHLGQFDSVLHSEAIFQLASESSSPSRSPLNHRTHLLEVNSIIIGAQLQLDWTYSENLHRHSTIERLAQEYLQALRELIAHCLAPDAGGYTPTDFPLAQLNSVVLEKLLSSVVPRQDLTKTNWKNLADIYPLSSVQQGILFHTLYAPDSGVYCQQLSCTFTGELDVEVFSAAWQQVIARHVVLRTAFTWEHSEQPLQVVYRQVKLPLEIHSWTGLSPQEQQQQLQTFIESEGQRGFQLSVAPLMRLSLIQMSDEVYQFVWTYHHILIDGWSLPLLFTEVLGYYEALSVGHELQLPPSRSYREYIAWLQKQNMAQAEQFWRQTLQGVTSPTPLVVDKAHHSLSGEQSYSEEILLLPRAATTALVSLARMNQLTLNTLVQAAWALLLWRYSGESDVVFGVTVSGRTAANGAESIVGLLINTLPMRVGVKGEESVLSWLKQVHKQQVEISTYEYTPLVQIQGWTDMPRGLPLFESIVVFENYPVDAALQEHSQKLHISDVRAIERTNYPLTLIAQPGEQLSLRFIYDTQRFDSATIARMADHFQTLLEGIITNPARQLSDIPLLTAAEQNQLLVEWNNTQADYPKQLCLHDLFEQQVQKTPNAIAVVFEDEQLTYSELNAKANQLAHHLRSLGVRPEVLVGICTERSTLMVIGLLAILKAGGAYVPLDPIYPPERLAYILSDACVSVLLTQQSVVDLLPDTHGHIVYLDQDWPIHQSLHNPNSGAIAENLAYAIYTSGSTGRPKGVQICHRAVVNFLRAMSAQPGMVLEDVLVAVTTITFDIAALELFLPLSLGASLVLSRELIADGGQSTAALATSSATVMQGTPATWRALMQAGFLGNPQLKILCGGEALDRELATQLLERADSLWNMYGPTETTIWSAVSQVQAGSGSVSIGKAIANTQFYILDTNLQPVPVGVAGELHIGGDGLARGYLNRPELTAEKFIPNPFDDAGKRLYKTGDLVRYLPDGNIEYIGRIDHQVKVRGFRIELGEIESLLSQHSTVQQAVVIAKEIAGDKRLVAYLLPQAEATPTMNELRSFLKQQLPEYMVPSYFIVLDALPLTPNGKVNRNALPDPDHSKLEVEAYVAPRNEVERLLSTIWLEVLNLEKVGVNDNFFELGGHSLLIVQLHSKLNNKLLGNINRDISVIDLFKYPTISTLAQYLGQEQNGSAPTLQKINDRASKQIKALKRQPLIKQRKKTNG